MKNSSKWLPYLDFAIFFGLFLLVAHHQLSPPHFSGWKQVVVTTGGSEWSIGAKYCPVADTREVDDAISLRNHISSIEIQPGEVLWVPTKAHKPGWLF